MGSSLAPGSKTPKANSEPVESSGIPQSAASHKDCHEYMSEAELQQ